MNSHHYKLLMLLLVQLTAAVDIRLDECLTSAVTPFMCSSDDGPSKASHGGSWEGPVAPEEEHHTKAYESTIGQARELNTYV
jgi:hypothetical protein